MKEQTCDPATIRAAELAPTSGTRSALVVIAMLLFGPFSIGTLAAIAIPAYQNYTIRAQVTEGLNAVDSFKIAVAEAVSQGRNWPEINTETLGLPQPDNLHYVESIRVDTGAVVIDYGRAANKAIWGMRIVLVPGMTPERDIVWVCGRAKVPVGVVMSIDTAARYTTIASQYLPASCHD